jgi:hypothetical protein
VTLSRTATAVAIALTMVPACGKKGPPLAPLHLIPSSATELTARRSGDDLELRFLLPTTNANGPETIDLARVEIFAVTIAANAVTPPNRDLLTKARLIGTMAVKPPPVEGEGEPEKPDPRPGPGERVLFTEQLTPATLQPQIVVAAKPTDASAAGDAAAKAAAAAIPATVADPAGVKADPAAQKADPGAPKPDPGTPKPDPGAIVDPSGKPLPPAATPAVATPPPGLPYAARIYVVRGLSRAGRAGPASSRIVLPLVETATPPAAVTAQLPTAQALVLDWTAPTVVPGLPAVTYNVYRSDALTKPLNPAPLAEAKYEIAGVEFGKELCYVVRAVQAFEQVTLESAPSAPACLTPLDTFPPAAPAGLRTVAEDGAISLVWDQNSEADLAGYIVLRGEAPVETLAPLTPKPITDANFRDATVKPGVRYVYAVIAVDRATPRNQSQPSAREEVTAR